MLDITTVKSCKVKTLFLRGGEFPGGGGREIVQTHKHTLWYKFGRDQKKNQKLTLPKKDLNTKVFQKKYWSNVFSKKKKKKAAIFSKFCIALFTLINLISYPETS